MQQSPPSPKPQLCDSQGNPIARLYNLPNLPPKFLPRPEELAGIKQKLLGDESQKLVRIGVSPPVLVHGMGGIGKTVLAAAVGQEEEVRRRFPDGVVWVTLGKPTEGKTLNLIRRQIDIAGYLLGNRPVFGFEDTQQGKAATPATVGG